MKRIICSLLFGAALLLSAREVNWTGYGAMTLTERQSGADALLLTFSCENEQRAAELQSKLRADLGWDPQNRPTAVALADGVSALRFPRNGVIALLRAGSTLHVAGAPDPERLRQALKEAGIDPAQCSSEAPGGHPARLDFYDLQALRMSLHGFNLLGSVPFPQCLERAELLKRFDFWKQFDPAIGMNNRSYFRNDNFFDAEPDTFWQQYHLQLAQDRGQSMNYWFGIFGAPLWFRNRYPLEVDRFEADAVPDWGDLATAGAAYPSYSSPAARAYAARFNRTLLQKLLDTAPETLGAIRVAAGRPGDEDGYHSLSTDLMWNSEAELAAFRRYLKNQGYDLAALGRRYFGDPGHYRSWEEVKPLRRMAYFGDLDQAFLKFDGDWACRPAVADEHWSRPDYRPGPEWKPNHPGQLSQLLWGELFNPRKQPLQFRYEFELTPEQLREHPDLYLVINNYTRQPVAVHLNGEFLGKLRSPVLERGPFGFRASPFLKTGRNLLALEVPSPGLLHGPVFLTTVQPAHYPYGGERLNARWVDSRRAGIDRIARNYPAMAADCARLAPDYPLLHTPGSSYDTAANFADFRRRAGITGLHQTGSEASFRPHWPALGYALGLHSSHEESGQCDDPERLTLEFNWFLFNADSAHNFVYDAIHYQRAEGVHGWFRRNARTLQLFGKAWWQQPGIGLLKTAASSYLFPDHPGPHRADLGMSQLFDAHYSYVYLTESELDNHLADDYPLLIDLENPVYDESLLAGLERYVRNGGCLVLQPGSGRHDPLRADSDPVSRLSGFRAGAEKQQQELRFEEDNALFPRLAGRRFGADGRALEALAPEAQILARWSDGSAAIGRRPLGRGQIITLGSSFWQSDRKIEETNVATPWSLREIVLQSLAEPLGIEPEIRLADPRLWARRQRGKNGLEEYLALWNRSGAALEKLEIELVGAGTDRPLRDLRSGREYPLRNRKVVLDFEPGELKLLAVNARPAAAALREWVAYHDKFFDRSQVRYPEPPPELPPARDLVFQELEFLHAGAEDAARPPAGTWRKVGPGFWEEQGFPARGTGFYRTSFELPSAWLGAPVNLQFSGADHAVFTGETTVYLNGREAAHYAPHMWTNTDRAEVTSLLKPGRNELLVKVRADRVRGGWLGQLGLSALEPLEEQRDLLGAVQLVREYGVPDGSVPLAGSDGRGRCLRFEVDVPDSWRGRNVLLDWADRSVAWGLVLVNGQPISLNTIWPQAGRIQCSLLPYLQYGRKNRIELWPYFRKDPSTFQLQHLHIGTTTLTEVPR